MHTEQPDDFDLVCPFWIDTDAYSDRDRQMFVAGYEFADLLRHIRDNGEPLSTTIHRENESRVRMACANFRRSCQMEPCQAEHDPDGTWSYLRISAREE